jgi:cytoskeleton protein RodZ
MSEEVAPMTPAQGSAGAMLRAARERQGVHIAVLAAAIKVSPRKLDALEADRYSELPDATFTRALAQTVCRTLKIDPQPVLALLPVATTAPLEAVAEGLNTPFKGRSGASSLSSLLPRAPLVWAALALIVAAVLVMYWPMRPVSIEAVPQAPVPPSGGEAAGATPAADDPALAAPVPSAEASASAAMGASGIAGVAASPASQAELDPAARALALPSIPPSVSGASISVSEPVWLEVIDGTDQVVFQRTIQPGETLTFEQRTPLKLKVGNAAGAQITFRGEPVDLAPFTRANVARVELK